MDDVRARAAEHGLSLDLTELNGHPVWGWHKGDDWRWPCYVTERDALDWMANWLRRRDAFEPKPGWS
jgi:hypothetical protein